MEDNTNYLMIKQQIKNLTVDEYECLKQLCHLAKNLTNQATYAIRQHYFETGKYLCYEKVYHELKTSENYTGLNSNMAEQIFKEVDGNFKSFFALLKLAKKGEYDYKTIKLPKYLPKDGYATLIISMVRIKDNKLTIPFSRSYSKGHYKIEITVPPILKDKTIKEVRIIPRSNARYFEIQYVYTAEINQRNLNKNNALAIDLGVNNLMTGVTNNGKTFIIDGKRLKSINQWYNKENARLQSIKDLQHIKGTTKRQMNLTRNRNNKVNDYIHKAVVKVINYCINNDIGTIVLGYNKDYQKDSNIGKTNNQNFVNIPYGRLRDNLEYLCELNDIILIIQEESYTSKASFWDKDDIPVFNEENTVKYIFSGKRIKRGLYKTFTGYVFNADVNGALNILKKSNVVLLDELYARGEVDTPVRIRIA